MTWDWNDDLGDDPLPKVIKYNVYPAVTTIKVFSGRFCHGWFAVEFFGSIPEGFDQWAKDNIAGSFMRDPIDRPRIYCKDETDALLCQIGFP